MDLLSWALLAIVAVSGLLQGLSGFAFPMLMTMLLTMFMPFQTAVAWTILPSLLLNGVSMLHGVGLRTLLQRYAVFAGLATVGSLLGVYVLLLVEALWLQLLLAVVMIWYVGRAWLRPAPLQVSTMPVWQLNSLGFLAGVVGSATNAMAPILMIALLAMNKGRRETIQVANLFFIFSKLFICHCGMGGGCRCAGLSQARPTYQIITTANKSCNHKASTNSNTYTPSKLPSVAKPANTA